MKSATITFRLSEWEKEQITLLALKKDIPASQLIREAIKSIIKEDQNNGD